MRTVLISGAGIAGPTLAYWLVRHGFRPTVVERARDLRSSGAPVDVRGPAITVADRMGVMPRLREAATDMDGLSFVNAAGRCVGHVNLRALHRATGSREVELPRGELAAVLHEAARHDAEFVFGDSIATLDQDPHGVDVTFEQAAPRRFDLVIGADGLHSTVRRLAFGSEDTFVHGLGLYIATMPLDDTDIGRDVLMHNAPGRLVAIHPARGSALTAFIFRHPPVPDLDFRDPAHHKRILTAAYARDGWRVPELLDHVHSTDDLYFDAVSRVTVDTWTRGRVTLLGDAASCVSVFGDGSSTAMAGAYTLAEELAAIPTNHAVALRRYEERHRRVVDPKQRGVGVAAAVLVPASRPGIVLRNLATRLWPVAAGVAWVVRRVKSGFQQSHSEYP